MVASPCINLCKMDRRSGLCLGCRRTLEEIADWSRLDDPQRQAILDKVAARGGASPAPSGNPPP